MKREEIRILNPDKKLKAWIEKCAKKEKRSTGKQAEMFLMERMEAK